MLAYLSCQAIIVVRHPPFTKTGTVYTTVPYFFAVCPGGEGAVLKTVGPKGLAGSNPVYGVLGIWCNGSTKDFDSVGTGSNPVIPAFHSSNG